MSPVLCGVQQLDCFKIGTCLCLSTLHIGFPIIVNGLVRGMYNMLLNALW